MTTENDPLITADELRLHMGELTADEVRIAQAAYRLGAARTRAEESSTLADTQRAIIEAAEKDARRYRIVREEGRDLADLLKLFVTIRKSSPTGTAILALRHTHYLDAAIDALAGQEAASG